MNLPPVPKVFADETRRDEVLRQVEQSGAKLIVLLGDEPIKHWLCAYDGRRRTLAAFGDTDDRYGRPHAVSIAGKEYEVLPLAHPRQVAGLGRHSPGWRSRHDVWRQRNAAAQLDAGPEPRC